MQVVFHHAMRKVRPFFEKMVQVAVVCHFHQGPDKNPPSFIACEVVFEMTCRHIEADRLGIESSGWDRH
jgi:hypothetical protein